MKFRTIVGTAFVLAFSVVQVQAQGLSDDTRARYRWQNGQWWYQKSNGSWMYHTNGQWVAFDPGTYRGPAATAPQPGHHGAPSHGGYESSDRRQNPIHHHGRAGAANPANRPGYYPQQGYGNGNGYGSGRRGYPSDHQDYGHPGYGYGRPDAGAAAGGNIGSEIGAQIGGSQGAALGGILGSRIGGNRNPR